MPPGAEDFFAKFSKTFGSENNHGNLKHSRHFALHAVRFAVASPSSRTLRRITQALAHLEVPAQGPDPQLTISLHAGTSPETSEFFAWLQGIAAHSVIRMQSETCMFLYNPGLDQSVPTFSFLDRQTGKGVFWIADIEKIPWYEVAAPFRTIFHWFFAKHGLLLVHGACIGMRDKGMVLAGKGGMGKTSTALTFLHHPRLLYVADDYFLLKTRPSPRALSLFSSAKVDVKTLSRFPDLQYIPHELADKRREKTAVFFYPEKPDVVANSLSIRALVIPQVAHRERSIFHPSTSGDALLSLAPSTIFQLRSEDPARPRFKELAELAKSVPSFTLYLGTDPKEIADSIVTFLESLP